MIEAAPIETAGSVAEELCSGQAAESPARFRVVAFQLAQQALQAGLTGSLGPEAALICLATMQAGWQRALGWKRSSQQRLAAA